MEGSDGACALAIVNGKVEAVGNGFGPVVLVNDSPHINIGLRERGRRSSGQQYRPVRRTGRNRVSQLGRRIVRVDGLQQRHAEGGRGPFIDVQWRVADEYLIVINGQSNDVKGGVGLGTLAVIDREGKAVGGGLATVMKVGYQSCVDICLSERRCGDVGE